MTRRWFLIGAGALSACGYHVGGKMATIPKGVDTIAIPPFLTITTRYRLVDALPQAIATEFTTRTRLKVVNDPSLADAVLSGRILSVSSYSNVMDPSTGRSASMRVNVNLTLNLVERSTGKVLYSRSNWGVHQDYATAIDAHQLFDESGPALERLYRDVARDVVSAVLENF